MPNIKTGVKVVRMFPLLRGSRNIKRIAGRYLSVFDDGKITEYVKDHWTIRTSNHGPFAVFDTIRNAKIFMGRLGGENDKDVYYFNCEYEESTEEDLYFLRHYQVWKRMINIRLPKGTKLADKVKITTLIK